MNVVEDRYLDLPGLSDYASMAVPTLRDYCRQGQLPYFKLKGKILIRKSEFDAWIEGFRADPKVKLKVIANDVILELKKAKSKRVSEGHN